MLITVLILSVRPNDLITTKASTSQYRHIRGLRVSANLGKHKHLVWHNSIHKNWKFWSASCRALYILYREWIRIWINLFEMFPLSTDCLHFPLKKPKGKIYQELAFLEILLTLLYWTLVHSLGAKVSFTWKDVEDHFLHNTAREKHSLQTGNQFENRWLSVLSFVIMVLEIRL